VSYKVSRICPLNVTSDYEFIIFQSIICHSFSKGVAGARPINTPMLEATVFCSRPLIISCEQFSVNNWSSLYFECT